MPTGIGNCRIDAGQYLDFEGNWIKVVPVEEEEPCRTGRENGRDEKSALQNIGRL